jgi:hypothetical protein
MQIEWGAKKRNLVRKGHRLVYVILANITFLNKRLKNKFIVFLNPTLCYL